MSEDVTSHSPELALTRRLSKVKSISFRFHGPVGTFLKDFICIVNFQGQLTELRTLLETSKIFSYTFYILYYRFQSTFAPICIGNTVIYLKAKESLINISRSFISKY